MTDFQRNGATASRLVVTLVGLYLFAVAVALVLVLIDIWPVRQPGADTNANMAANGAIFGLAPNASLELLFVFIALIGGSVGSYIHAATSFATFVGNRTLVKSWIWWYLLRLPIGGTLALLVYTIVRAGFLSVDAAVNQVNPYAVVAVSGLVGMFSKQATDKLRELFDTLFKVKDDAGDAARLDKADAGPSPGGSSDTEGK